MGRRATLLFPPNWSACVAGPHLAMPLMAGVARARGWETFCWDLTEEFNRTVVVPPSREAIKLACFDSDFAELDRLYFSWEDQFRTLLIGKNHYSYGLLSGFGNDELLKWPLSRVDTFISSNGTLFDQFFFGTVIPKLVALNASVIGVTIASQHQVIPALRLLQLMRCELPESIVVLGGNVVTRLRGSPAFQILQKYVDHVVIFQGDLAFDAILERIETSEGQKRCRPHALVSGEQNIPYAKWRTPNFQGIEFERIVGTPVVPYVSTRGCYWGRCSFCAIPIGWSKTGYAGSAPAKYVFDQLIEMTSDTNIPRVKFVDEALAPSKAKRLSSLIQASGHSIEWEAYGRLEKAWEDATFLEDAYAGGLRKLYLGLEQAPTTDRSILGKNDSGDIVRIMKAASSVGLKLHLFCMVGHPQSTYNDALATTNFLIEHESLVDTADLVGFRLDLGTTVQGVAPTPDSACDWNMSLPYFPVEQGVLSSDEVEEIEHQCQEVVWEQVPRLLHPLYRVIGPWSTLSSSSTDNSVADRSSELAVV